MISNSEIDIGPKPQADADPDRACAEEDLSLMIHQAALFSLDTFVDRGGLTDVPLADRMAVALFQFDFLTARALLGRVPPGVWRNRLSGLLLFEDSDADQANVVQDRANRTDVDDGNKTEGLGNTTLLDDVLTPLERAANAIITGQAIDPGRDPLFRYIFARMLLHGYTTVTDLPEAVFSRPDLSEGEMYCASRYYIDKRRFDEIDLTLNALWTRYRRSGHLAHLGYLLARQRNAPHVAAGCLLNAATLPGLDERIVETVHAMFGPGVDTAGANRKAWPDETADLGLRGLRGMLEPNSYASRRETLRVLKRPDSLINPCDRFTDTDLDADIASGVPQVREALAQADGGPPQTQGPLHRDNNAPSGLLFVFPPRSGPDIAIGLSSVSSHALVGTDVLSRLTERMNKLEPGWDGRLTPEIMERHGGFLREMWISYVARTLGPLRAAVPRWHVGLDLRQSAWLKALWPLADHHLCVPDARCVTALGEAGLDLGSFRGIYCWRLPRDQVALLRTLGVSRAGRRVVMDRLSFMRGFFYPT
ncbi:hypothetical protein [Rhodospira trueperi]|nr:hypothetical protein [Rhodospira trueperi]